MYMYMYIIVNISIVIFTFNRNCLNTIDQYKLKINMKY